MNQCIDRIIQIIRENRDKIKEHLAGLNEVCIVTDNLDYATMNAIGNKLLEGKVSDYDLFLFTDNGIRMLEITDDVYNELKVLIPKDVERLVLPASILRLNSKMSDFPKLKEVVSSTYFNLRENSLEEELAKVIRLDFPHDGKLGELFDKNFIVTYIYAEQVGLNRVEIFDRRDKSDALLSSGVISISLDSEKVIDNIRISKLDMEEISLFFEWLKNEKYDVDDVTLVLENKTIPNISLLEKYTDDFDILIDYGEFNKTNYEDYVSMRASIDWYKEIITSSDLSPFEQLIFAYDILKTFVYSEGTKAEDSRYVPNIIRTGNIVCVGYSKLLEMIVNELGIKSASLSVGKEGESDDHQRVAVRLDDDKYDIHGVFAVDATWDRGIDELSLVENSNGNNVIRMRGRKDDDKIMKEYDALTLYNCFLIPYGDYGKAFWDEELPDIFRIFEANSSGYDYDIFDSCSLEFKNLFDNLDRDFIKSYIFNSKKPSLEKFKEALSVVRRAEGYIDDDVSRIADDTVELNQMLDDCGVFFREKDSINKK